MTTWYKTTQTFVVANESFDFDFNPGINQQLINDLIAERYERTATVITSDLDVKSYCTPRGEAGSEKSVVAQSPETAK